MDFDRIRETHAPLVWSVVARILKNHDDALDCFQDVFAEALVRGRRKDVADWGALLRWLATRRAIDVLRRSRNAAVTTANADRIDDSSETAENQLTFAELVERVRSELAYLPAQQAEAFWLVCVEGHTYGEVAGLMGIESNAVGVHVHRARQHMKSRLKSFKPAGSD